MARQRTAVPVKAPAETIFALLERDRTVFRNGLLNRRQAIGAVPFGLGYRFRSTLVHEGETCVMDTCVTVFDRPRVLAEEWQHHCNVDDRVVHGADRWELEPDGDVTLLIGTAERSTTLFQGIVAALLGSVPGGHKARLLRLGARAEALAHAQTAGVPDALTDPLAGLAEA